MKCIIFSEHSGWQWRIEQQDDCESGVIVTLIQGGIPEDKVIHLGTIEDAKQFAETLLLYVDTASKRNLRT